MEPYFSSWQVLDPISVPPRGNFTPFCSPPAFTPSFPISALEVDDPSFPELVEAQEKTPSPHSCPPTCALPPSLPRALCKATVLEGVCPGPSWVFSCQPIRASPTRSILQSLLDSFH